MLESAHRLVGAAWGDDGTTRIQQVWTADPDLIRSLDTGQACYLHRGGATFVQVARPKPSPLSLPAAGRPMIVPPARDDGGHRHQDGPPTVPLPVIPGGSPPLDDVLGPARGGRP